MAVVAPQQEISPDTTGKNDPIAALYSLCREDMTAVNTLILQRMQSEVSLIPQIAGHIIAAGGKRLRPLLTLSCAGLCGYRGEDHIGLAATVEFIHTATLLHDDVVDESGLRRGANTANAVWGNKPSVLVGDFLFSRAFLQMVRAGSLEILEILSRASAIIAQGEVQQLMTANDITTDEAGYLSVISAKTAALFAAACEIGAVVAGRPENEAAALHTYGLNLGIAFQLVDDCLDYSAREDELGKALGDDFRDGKITLPVILAISQADDKERAFWRRTLEELDHRDGDFDRAIDLIRKYGALEASLARAQEYSLAAVDALAIFPASPYRDALTAVAAASVARAT